MASKNTGSKNISASARTAEKSDANAVKATVASGPAAATKAPATPVTVPAVTPAPAATAAPAAALTAAPAAAVAPAVKAVVAAPVAVTSTPAADAVRERSAIVALVARLRDQDAEVARDAAGTLGNLPADAQSVSALSAVLVNGDGYYHSVVRAAAAAALGKLGDKSAVDALIHATRDEMAEASEEAIKALGTLRDARAIPALEAIVRNANGFFLDNVIRAAQESLRGIRSASAKA